MSDERPEYVCGETVDVPPAKAHVVGTNRHPSGCIYTRDADGRWHWFETVDCGLTHDLAPGVRRET